MLTWAAELTNIHWDPVKAQSAAAVNSSAMFVYEPLLRGYFDRPAEPGLATKVTVVDPTTIDVEIRQGTTFTDGTPVNAEAVKFSLERTRDNAGTSMRPDIKDLATVAVTGPYSVRLGLARPGAEAWVSLLAGPEGIIVSPTAATNPAIDLDTTPVGSGPFVLESFQRDQRARLVKNPDYWDADNIKLGGIDLVQVSTGAPQILALRSGDVDYAGFFNSADVQQLRGSEIEHEIVSSPTAALWVLMCKSLAPIDDVRVRQALNIATDRDAVNNVVTGGLGEPMWSQFPKGDPRHVDELDDFYPHDPDRARRLLAEAGYPDGLEIDLIVSTDTRFPELLQQQWAQAGITLNLVPSANFVQDLLIDRKAPLGTATVARPGLERLTQHYGSASLSNFCNYSDPTLQAMIERLRVIPPDGAEADQLWTDAQRFILDNALNVWTVFLPVAAGWSSRVGGVDLTIVGAQPPFPHLKKVFIEP